ncbi:MAG: ABC transporter permease, partial [Planctomycetes bacterium]|nr:ABC transporter permease [Planctomycetota bacterium]
FTHYYTLFLSPMFLFSGVFFPTSTLPAWARVLSWFLPLPHAVAAQQALFHGHLTWAVVGHLAWLLGCAGVFYRLSLALMRRRLIG